LQEEYLALDKDPENQSMWLQYHLQKCYTPYMDAMGCLVNVKDREVSKWKQEAGPDGWKLIEQKWIHDAARKVGENKAKMMWELTTNFKQIFDNTRQRDGHLYGEQPTEPDKNNNSTTTSTSTATELPTSMIEIMGMGDLPSYQTGVPKNSSHERLETLMARAKQNQLQQQQQQREREEAMAKKSFWTSFGGGSASSTS
jgi:hypothetical protein